MSDILECRQLSKHFGGLKAVDEVNFNVSQGEILGIIGPNGAGKTTLFNLIAGVYMPTSGQVMLEDTNISRVKPDKIARLGIARTFQNLKLFKDLSTLENVKLGFHNHMKTKLWDGILHTPRYKKDEKYASEKGIELLRRVGIDGYADMLAGNLPYGLQRKLEIARALAIEPKLLLLDEPAAGMNPSETNELMQLIQTLNKDGITIVVIEHDMKFVMNLCHRIVVLNFGKKISEGSPDEIVKNEEVRKAYLGSDDMGKFKKARRKK